MLLFFCFLVSIDLFLEWLKSYISVDGAER